MRHLGDLCVSSKIIIEKEDIETDFQSDELSIKNIIPKKEN